MKFLASREFKLKDEEEDKVFNLGPDWFPHHIYPNYKKYEYVDMETEQMYLAFISVDSTVIYGFYFSY